MSAVTITYQVDRDDMRQRGLLGALATHSRHDSKEITKAARQAFLSTFEQSVDPGRVLSDEERQRRAAHARRAHFVRLARASAKARRSRKEGGTWIAELRKEA